MRIILFLADGSPIETRVADEAELKLLSANLPKEFRWPYYKDGWLLSYVAGGDGKIQFFKHVAGLIRLRPELHDLINSARVVSNDAFIQFFREACS